MAVSAKAGTATITPHTIGKEKAKAGPFKASPFPRHRHQEFMPASPVNSLAATSALSPEAHPTCLVCVKRMVNPFAVCERRVGRKTCEWCAENIHKCLSVSEILHYMTFFSM